MRVLFLAAAAAALRVARGLGAPLPGGGPPGGGPGRPPRRPPAPGDWLAAARRRGFGGARPPPPGAPGAGAEGLASQQPLVFSPAALGGDPLGQNDSTAAVQAAVDAAFRVVVPGSFIGNGSSHGGATVDLEGGEFLVSAALRLHQGGGVRLCCGALRASPGFPASAFLLNAHGPKVEDLHLEDVLLDLAQTGGGIHLSDALRVHVARCYVHGFTTVGLVVNGGHEVHLSESFLGQYHWGEGEGRPLSGVAVQIAGQDHWIDDVVIFSGAVGIQMSGGAAIVANTHIYNGGGPALITDGRGIRVVGCYFDAVPYLRAWPTVLLVDPVAIQISHSFFLGAGVGVELRSSGRPGAFVNGLQIVDNQFDLGGADVRGGNPVGITVNESLRAFAAVNETFIGRNVYAVQWYGPSRGLSMGRKSTEAWRTILLSAAASRVAFDVRDALLFDCERVSSVAGHSVVLPLGSDGFFARTALRVDAGGGCRYRVDSDAPLPAGTRVTVRVRQADLYGQVATAAATLTASTTSPSVAATTARMVVDKRRRSDVITIVVVCIVSVPAAAAALAWIWRAPDGKTRLFLAAGRHSITE